MTQLFTPVLMVSLTRLDKVKLAADLEDDLQSGVNWGNGLLILTLLICGQEFRKPFSVLLPPFKGDSIWEQPQSPRNSSEHNI